MVETTSYFDRDYRAGAIPATRLGPGASLRELCGLSFDPTITARECQLTLWLACQRALRLCRPDSREMNWWQDLLTLSAADMPKEWNLMTLERLHELNYIEITLDHLRQRMPFGYRDNQS
jgi:hypothetical protein